MAASPKSVCVPCHVAAITHTCMCKRSSVVRSFRYVATLTAQRIVTSLVTATLQLGEARETAQRQLSAEKAKKGSKVRAGTPCSATAPSTGAHGSGASPAPLMGCHCCPLLLACPKIAPGACLHVSVVPEAQHAPLVRQERVASFQRTLDACHSQAKALEASIAAIWQGIFSARFRDVDADIRASVIRGIGEWMSLNPADFLNDNYLKYVAWALSDRVSKACSRTTFTESMNKPLIHT